MSALENLKVLCIEDDPFAREEMVYFLRKRAGKVFSAANGMEGLEQIELHEPDVIIVDLLMPGMDGLTMLRNLRAAGNSAHAVIVTSVNAVETVIEAVELGIDSYIVKPLDFAELELKLGKISDAITIGRGTSAGSLSALENKRAAEDGIKKSLIRTLKDYTGKGPREAVVQLLRDEVKITVFGALTTMETNLAKDVKNMGLVKQSRNAAYEAMGKGIEKLIEREVGMLVSLDKIEIDLKKGMDQLRFLSEKKS